MSLAMKWLLLVLALTASNIWADTNPRIVCMGNLKQIDGAVQLWASENDLSDTNAYSLQNEAILQNLPGGYLMNCPAGGVYQPGKTVDNEPRCSVHGSLTDMHYEYLAARKRHNTVQIVMGFGAGLLGWLIVRWLNTAQSAGRITESSNQLILPGILLLMGAIAFVLPQDTLRPTFGIVRPILHVPTAVFCLSGLIVTIAVIIRGRKTSLIALCMFSGVFVFMLSVIILYWLKTVWR